MKGINIDPIYDRVIVLPDAIEEKLGSGLLIKAETTKVDDRRKQVKGLLTAVGPDAFADMTEPVPKVGDRVIFSRYAGSYFKDGDLEYRIMLDAEIVGIIKE